MDIKDIGKKLWNNTIQLKGNMSVEEYMHIILGILSLKYISDKFDKSKQKMKKEGLSINDLSKSEFFSEYNAFKVPKESHWNAIMNYSQTNEIGLKIDEAFIALEKENKMLNGLFNKNYNKEGIDQNKLGEIVKIFSNENFIDDQEDIIGKIYEHFLENFFRDKDKEGEKFYTPKSIIKLIVNLIKPLEGSIYDPCCGTARMLIQAKRHIEENGGNIDNIVVYGQEYNNISWKLAKLNLILNGFPLEDIQNKEVLGKKSANTFTNDQHINEKFDFIMANPIFNKKWEREQLKTDLRWKNFGLPPKNNSNYAWLLHIIYKLNKNGKAIIVLPNGSLSSSIKSEFKIRKNIIEKNVIDAIISLPKKLFYGKGDMKACLWILNNNKNKNILMIDASNFKGKEILKSLHKITYEENKKISNIYNKHNEGEKIEEKKFAKSINLKKIKKENYNLNPSIYLKTKEKIINREKIKREIEKSIKEVNELFKEIEKLLPKINKSVKKALEFKNKNNKNINDE